VAADPNLQSAVDAFQRGDLERARALVQARLDEAPDPTSQHLMGLIECRSGRLEAGIDWLGRACQAEPDTVSYRVMLVRALNEAGRPREALEIARPPAGSTPPELALWHARAEAASAIEVWPEAAEAWARLCLSGAADWRGWSSYGITLGALGRWPEAVAAYRQAAALNPLEPTLIHRLATALGRSGQHQESADQLLRWIEFESGDPALRIMLARLLADLGRQAESDEQLAKAAELATGVARFDDSGESLIEIASAVAPGERRVDPLVLRELAYLLERTNRSDALREVLVEAEKRGVGRDQVGYPAAAVALRDGDPDEAKRLLLTEPPDRDPTRWHRLMARIADALDDPVAAFAEAEAMNRAANDHDMWRGRAAEYLRWTRGLAAMLTPEWVDGLTQPPPTERRAPAFLVGFPRSGTTLLDTFLMGHSDTAVLEEVPLMHQAQTVLGDFAQLPSAGIARLEQARGVYFAELDRHLPPEFGGLAVDKMPLNLLAMPYAHCLFPGARIIFVQRHPCDVVLSCFMQGFALNDATACFLDLGDAAAAYDSIMTMWTRSRELLPLDVHTVVYERLVAATEDELRPLVDFLDLEWQAEMIDHRSTARARGAIGTPSYDQVVEPLSKAPNGRWRRFERQLEPALPILLPWAERLGYRD
jgi:Flp pilus assembly protein TadD